MKKYVSPTVSMLGMVLILAVAYGLDVWLDKLRMIAQSKFTLISTWLLPATILELLFVCLLLAWLWYVTRQDDNNLIVNILFILVGLGLHFYNYLATVSGLPLPMLLAIIPKSLSSLTSAIVAVAGLQRLIFGRKPVPA
jgi:hypothetical protein